MPERYRKRAGKEVTYYPTAAEVTANGAGPWRAFVTKVNPTGTVDLLCDLPSDSTVGAAVADPLLASADPAAALAAFTDPPNAAEMALLRTLVNELRTAWIEVKADVNALAQLVNQLRTGGTNRRKLAVTEGQGPGQCWFISDGD